jgi:hypothetical protein
MNHFSKLILFFLFVFSFNSKKKCTVYLVGESTLYDKSTAYGILER